MAGTVVSTGPSGSNEDDEPVIVRVVVEVTEGEYRTLMREAAMTGSGTVSGAIRVRARLPEEPHGGSVRANRRRVDEAIGWARAERRKRGWRRP